LDGELAKYESWEECKKDDKFVILFIGHVNKKTGKHVNPKAVFGQSKGQGIGRAILLKFLGKAWKALNKNIRCLFRLFLFGVALPPLLALGVKPGFGFGLLLRADFQQGQLPRLQLIGYPDNELAHGA
jgi:hypothetical protein